MINSMSDKGYTVSMVFDSEDKIIVGRVLDIDDIISIHDESVAKFESKSIQGQANQLFDHLPFTCCTIQFRSHDRPLYRPSLARSNA